MEDAVNATESLRPGIQRLLAESRGRMPRAVAARERRAELIVGGAFAAAAVLIAALVTTEPPLDWTAAILATVSLAAASLVVFEVGSVYTFPTQVAFVPMLFVLPPELVPIFVFAGLMIGKVGNALADRLSPGRVLMAAGDSWFAVGPALVLIAAGAPSAASAPWYVLAAALASQFAVESLASGIRERLHGDASPRDQFAESRWIYLVDTLLAPIGFAVALAATGRPWALMLPLPLFLLLLIFARERTARLQSLLELSSAYRGTAHVLGDMIGHDDAYTGTHSRSVVELSVAVADRARRSTSAGAATSSSARCSTTSARSRSRTRSSTSRARSSDARVDGGPDPHRRRPADAREDRRPDVEIGTVVRSSHERYDGGGYPDGLAGEEIPIESRIIFACDAFNAMTTDRPYRTALPIEAAIGELEENAGTQFDPRVVGVLVGQVRDRYGIPA